MYQVSPWTNIRVQDTLANSKSSMTIVQAKSLSNSMAISIKRVSFPPASTFNIVKLNPGSICCYLLEVSESSSSCVFAPSAFFPHLIVENNFRPLHLESLITKKLVGRLWEESFWAMCIKRCFYIDNLQYWKTVWGVPSTSLATCHLVSPAAQYFELADSDNLLKHSFFCSSRWSIVHFVTGQESQKGKLKTQCPKGHRFTVRILFVVLTDTIHSPFALGMVWPLGRFLSTLSCFPDASRSPFHLMLGKPISSSLSPINVVHNMFHPHILRAQQSANPQRPRLFSCKWFSPPLRYQSLATQDLCALGLSSTARLQAFSPVAGALAQTQNMSTLFMMLNLISATKFPTDARIHDCLPSDMSKLAPSRCLTRPENYYVVGCLFQGL